MIQCFTQIIWVKVFQNGPCKLCGKQPFKNFTWSILEYLEPYIVYQLKNTSHFHVNILKNLHHTKATMKTSKKGKDSSSPFYLLINNKQHIMVIYFYIIAWLCSALQRRQQIKSLLQFYAKLLSRLTSSSTFNSSKNSG